MSLQDWDKELSVVAREIEHVTSLHGKARLSGNKSLLTRKVAIIQSQINLDRTLERIKKLTQREFMLLPRERALVHWGAMYLEAVAKQTALQTKHATKTLWLRLVRSRLVGPIGSTSTDLEQDDLVSIAVRQTNLAKTESFLAETLVSLRQKRKVLTRRYQSLGVVDANRTASGTLGVRLGSSPLDAMQSPTFRSIEAYFRLVTAPVNQASAAKHFEDVTKRASGKTDGLMGLCRSLVVARLKDPAAKPTSRVLDKFQLALEQLADLEAETREAYGQILGSTAVESRPIQVQNLGGHAKTDPTN